MFKPMFIRSGQGNALKRLMAYTRPHKLRFAVAFSFLLVAVSAEMAIPWLAKIIIDDVIVPQTFDWHHLLTLSAAVLVLYLVQCGFQYLQAVSFRHSALLVVNDVRKQLFNHVLKLPISAFDRTATGRMVSYVTNDTESLRDLFVSTLPTIIQGSLRITGIFVAIALLDWRLMVLSLVLIPILLMTMHWYRKLSTPVLDGIRVQVSHINNRISESLQGMSLVQAFGQEKAFREKFKHDNDGWFAFRTRSIAIDSLMLLPFTRLVGAFAALAIVAWFGTASLQTVVEIGTLYAFLNYIERFFEPFRQLSMELRKMQVALVSSARVFELLDEPTDEAHKEDVASVSLADNKDIEFRHVRMAYEEGINALDDVSFVAKSGQFTAIVGHSGSGKSSVVNLLMRFYQHHEGEVLIGGKPIQTLPDSQVRQLIGLVSQDPYMFSGSIKENIDLSLSAQSSNAAMLAAQAVNASSFIERLPQGYDHQPGHGGASLSVGEKQLVALARVLAHGPEIYLLDEATANIDSETEEAVKRALSNIQQGRTVIAVAHRLSTVRNADQILVMSKGKIVQRGTHDELVSQTGEYRELYLAQKEKEEHESENAHLGLATA
ncbi:ABC transporter ATP-binding protein/permease [Enterovibrio sp. ZSDZ35]|uniref:ABC transporter ATP-binding protein/permease n=1 Tax=Enterovibrio qingdaonensis TaxID=2899818 RepID=A0ABT5QHB4_9GAMM|nr:ABC transporter ATP-binding protein [Enterovibrio sp. ZSDZ35]MDD1780352.1 ABC transporter ATP-binding protein/permease [Enterovibrio sp. ZSDZ35]